MAVHNREGAEALRDLGFKRVVLARELTLDEITDICHVPGIEKKSLFTAHCVTATAGYVCFLPFMRGAAPTGANAFIPAANCSTLQAVQNTFFP